MQKQNIGSAFAQHPTLWQVNDRFLDEPERKLTREHSPLTEATVENWGCFPFDNAPVDKDMVQFVGNFLTKLRIKYPESIGLEELCDIFLHRLDYNDPYFFLFDMLIQPSHNELTHTYRHRQTQDILDAKLIETFHIVTELKDADGKVIREGWKFAPFMYVGSLFRSHKLFVNNLWHDVNALESFLQEVCLAVWGSHWDGYKEMAEEAMEEYRNHQIYERDHRDEADARHSVRLLEGETWTWMAVGLACMAWFKSPNSLEYLLSYHPVYGTLLDISDDGKVVPIPGSGNEVIIDGMNIYTHKTLELLPGRPPASCAGCGANVHCTKFLNVTALFNPVCSCGGLIDPEETEDLYGSKHNKRECQPYKLKQSTRTGYVCQRCIWMAANQLDGHTKCGRTICPAVKCPHHLGVGARMHALTRQRTMQLTAPPRG